MRRVWLLLALVACEDPRDRTQSDAGKDAGSCEELSVEIGLRDEQLRFHALEPGGDIPLETFGQGGTHATLAIRTRGFGKLAFVDVELENLTTGDTAATVPSSRPQLLLCRDARQCVCDLLPLHVMTGGLAEPDQKDGLRIRVTAEVSTEDGLTAVGSQEGVLRKAF
jgi:hypothetical protein